MGLATGEAELRDGDYFGAVLNRAARVMAAGHGGQILLAESTAGCSAESIWWIWGRDGCGMCRRRFGYSRSERGSTHGVSAVAGAGCESGEPAACDHEPHRARVRGRRGASRGEGHRVVTLTGVGGSARPAWRWRSRRGWSTNFPDGVWFFELAAVTDPAAVPDAVAAVLGITQQPGRVARVGGRRVGGQVRLLVFDNCEHLRDAAADLIEAILARSATARILATGREGLGVADEHLWRVPSLEVGAGIDSAAASCLSNALRAFRRASRRPSPRGGAVVEICRAWTDPVAIELAASWWRR